MTVFQWLLLKLSVVVSLFSSKNNGSSEFLSEILPSNVFDINDQSYLENLLSKINKNYLLSQSKIIHNKFDLILKNLIILIIKYIIAFINLNIYYF